MATLPDFIDTLFVRLAWTAAQATVLIGVLWLLGRYVRQLSPAIRCMLWWLVAAQLVLGLAVSAPVELHWLSPSVQTVTTITHNVVEQTPAGITHIATTTTAPPERTTWFAYTPTWSWPQAIVTLWLLGVLLQLLFAVREWHESRALVRDSQPLRDAALQLLCAEQAHALRLRHIPHLRMSEGIVSPQVTGLWRPLVLLPAEQTLSSEELAMALAHELAHLRRGDLWLGWIPAIAQRLFFFHPLVTWAMREYAVYREAACDAQVLQRNHAAPQIYGHLLLRLGVAQPVHAGLAGASSTFQNLKRRLVLLQQSVNDTTPRTHGWLLVAVIALVGVLPYRVTATNTVQSTSTTQTTTNDGIPSPPLVPATPPTPATPVTPPTPPTPATPATPPTPAEHGFGFNAHEVDIDTQPKADRGIALLDGDRVMVDGSDDDLANAQRLYKSNDPMLWFRRGEQAYVVHDPRVMQQARNAYAPINQLNREQGLLAGKQGALAGREGGLAARQGSLASREAELESRRVSLESSRIASQSDPSSPESMAREASLHGQLEGLDREEAEISRENKILDQDQKALSDQQAALSRQGAEMSKQGKLVAQQAYKQLDKVLDDALAKGLAQPATR